MERAPAAGVRVEEVSKRFQHRVKGDLWAVREVSLAVRPGELLTLSDAALPGTRGVVMAVASLDGSAAHLVHAAQGG